MPPNRSELIAQLVQSRIAGEVATPRDNNLAHFRKLAEGNRYYWLGLEFGDRWRSPDDVLRVMVERCGVRPDPAFRAGIDTIDPELTVDALDRAAVVLRKAAAARQRVLVATGHPTGLLAVHQAVARGLAAAGCELVIAGDDLPAEGGLVRYVGGVAMLRNGGELMHTHSGDPMRAILSRLESDGRPLPDLVFADHGWAGYAGERGLDSIGFADCNDPALFVGEAEGKLLVTIPLDDNVAPMLYDPLTAYLLDAAGLG